MNKNPVLVMPSKDVASLDMMPRVNIIEDMQFRKALPKTFKLYDKCAPFSEKLGKIKDSKKFMNKISQDMLSTVMTRDARTFKNQRELDRLEE